MRKSAKISLVVAICLLTLGIVLVAAGIMQSNPEPSVYTYAGPHFRMSYSYRVNHYDSRTIFGFLQFGRMAFLSGLVMLGVFTVLAVQKPLVKNEGQGVHEMTPETEANAKNEEKSIQPTVIYQGPPQENGKDEKTQGGMEEAPKETSEAEVDGEKPASELPKA